MMMVMMSPTTTKKPVAGIPRPFAGTTRQRRGGICIVVNQFEEDCEAPVDIDMDAEDEFIFDEELSSNIGSSMTALENHHQQQPVTGNHKTVRRQERTRRAGGGQGESINEMPLIRKLFSLAMYRKRGQGLKANKQETDRCTGGGAKRKSRMADKKGSSSSVLFVELLAV